MTRIHTTLAAMAAAAAVAAAITIPAVATQNGGGGQPDPAVAKLTSCLTAHGVALPSGLDGVALKQWLGAHQDDHTVAAAMQACAGGDAGNCGGAAKPAPSGDQPAETAKQPGS